MEKRDDRQAYTPDGILAEAASVWTGQSLPPISGEDRRQVRETAAGAVENPAHTDDYVMACECFYLFRCIHRLAEAQPAWATLTGDYFFSRFSHALIPIDSVPLIDRFSDFLKEDARRGSQTFDLAGYLDFIRQTAVEIS